MRYQKQGNTRMILERQKTWNTIKISDFYTCKNNRKLTVSHIRHNKTKTGHAVQKIPKQRDCECTR